MFRRLFALRTHKGSLLPCMPLLAGLAAPLLAQSDYATPYAFNAFAGSGIAGYADATGTAAQFDRPYGLALDSSGTLYVADRGNQIIRKVTAAGVVTTVAGTVGISGSTDATGTAAQFSQPGGLTVGSGGDIYVADTGNQLIRKIGTGGVVTTLAGAAGTAGSTNGTGTTAEFSQPYGIVIDSSGNLFVTELGSSTIREVTQAGVVTLFAGTAGSAGSTDGAGTVAVSITLIGTVGGSEA